MTTFDRFDPFERRITEAIDEIAAVRPPDYLADILRQTARASQRPRWTFPGSWLPRPWALPLSPVARLAILVAIVAALLTAAAAGGWITRLAPWLHAPFPLVEDLGQLGGGEQVSAFRGVLLEDGSVLLVGGVDTTGGQRTLSDAWIFDPDTKRLLPTGALIAPRTDPELVALADGRVLVFGGYSEDSTTGEQGPVLTAELYEPSSGAFRPTTALPVPRRACPCGALNDLPWSIPWASLLADGRVFVSGGAPIVAEGADPFAPASRADLYDPIAERWSQLEIGCDASRGTQTLLDDGRLLVLCITSSSDGEARVVDVRARLFDPATNTFVEGPKPPSPARQAVRLPDGRVLLTGFAPFVYDPGSNSFALVALEEAVSGQTGFVVRPDRVLFLGDPSDIEASFPTLLLDTAEFRITTVEHPSFATSDVVVRLLDGRLLTVGYQLQTRLLDPSQLP